ncbi:MAG: CoA pyrophosphatase, partial [Bacillota bacterium]|nr:CoA pyrophosphatase [Bacillota bacterium]
MENKSVIDIFKGRKGKSIRPFKKSAVVILLLEKEDGYHILFEVRALNLKSQPGDICLPGGKVEEGEEYKETASRELKEELGYSDEDFQIIGEMDFFVSPYGSIIYPFVGEAFRMPDRFNNNEVEEVFSVPLEYFLKNNPICHSI